MRRIAGFTLVELMATTAVVAILASIALPAWNEAQERASAATASHRLTASLAAARGAAVTRRTHVSVCPTRDGRTCTGGLEWEPGWMVFVDRRRAGHPADASDILSVVEPANRVRIRSTGGRRLVRYQPDGRSPGSNVTLSICSMRTERAMRRAVVNNVGRVRSERPSDDTPCRN